jgi:hypothetical protein
MVMAGALWSSVQAQGIQCDIQANDVYGTPAAGISVTIYGFTSITDSSGIPLVISNTAPTGADGHVTVVLQPGPYVEVFCGTNSAAANYAPYPNELSLSKFPFTGTLVVVPKPITVTFPGGGAADLYLNGGYDRPVVIAEPFFSDEPVEGPMSASDLWIRYNGNPQLLSGVGLLQRLYSQNFDVWLFRPRRTGDDLNLQAMDYARAVQNASRWQSFNSKVVAAGYSMGGLVVRSAMSRWGWDAGWRSSLGLDPQPPVNLIATLDSPLRGALVSNDLQHAFWNATNDNGQSAKDHNMDSCAAQQMLERACHKTVGCPDCLECNDRGWYETFYGGNSFTYCNPVNNTLPLFACISIPGVDTGIRTCSNPGVGILRQPGGGWPAGIRKIAASLGKFGERTGVCYGDTDPRDKNGDTVDGCPALNAGTFDLGTEWGFIDISLSTDRVFRYNSFDSSSDPSRQHWTDELTPGSRQPGSVEDVAKKFLGFKVVNGHQLLHMGTFLPLYSALDQDPVSGAIPFDEYWTNSFSAFHDAFSDQIGTWVNQRTQASGPLSMPDWLIRNLNAAFTNDSSSVCGEATCVPAQAAYISHFTSAGCTGTESYYLPYDGFSFSCRTWDGNGECGTVQRTVTNISYKYNGACYDAWPGGNTLSSFVTVYRGGTSSSCGEANCVPAQAAYISHFTNAGCTGTESYYLPYDGFSYSCRTWDGNAQCGTIHHTVTNVSYKYNGACYDAWPGGNTLSDFVTVYR